MVRFGVGRKLELLGALRIAREGTHGVKIVEGTRRVRIEKKCRLGQWGRIDFARRLPCFGAKQIKRHSRTIGSKESPANRNRIRVNTRPNQSAVEPLELALRTRSGKAKKKN
jgi:hypothetical protein